MPRSKLGRDVTNGTMPCSSRWPMGACAPAKRWRSPVGGYRPRRPYQEHQNRHVTDCGPYPPLRRHPEPLAGDVRGWCPRGRPGNPAPAVFASEAATPLDYAGVARRFRAILVRAKLPNHSPYDLRHTTTLRHYAH